MPFTPRRAAFCGLVLRFFPPLLLLFLAAWILPWPAAVAAGGRSGDAVTADEDADGDPSAPTESPGPWGVLEAYKVFISAPESILDLFPIPSGITTWTFPGMSADEVAASAGTLSYELLCGLAPRVPVVEVP
jgi:hypothetical protein